MSDELLIPSYDEITYMKNHYPDLDRFIEKKEKQYMQICAFIDKSDKSAEQKKIEKNTYYIYLMTVKKILNSKNLKCCVSISGHNYNEITLDQSVYKFEFDYELLENLIMKNNLCLEPYYGDGFTSIDI